MVTFVAVALVAALFAPDQPTLTHPALHAQVIERVAEQADAALLASLKTPEHDVAVAAGRARLAAERAAEAARVEAARQAAAAEAARAAERARVVRPATGEITSQFGMRTHPLTGVYKLHSGTDFASGDGNAYAAMAGRVSISHPGWAGILVSVDHGDGLVTTYAHLARDTVSPGQWVAAGDRVGIIGARGMATGVHLHWEVIQDGRYVDGLAWLADRGVRQ